MTQHLEGTAQPHNLPRHHGDKPALPQVPVFSPYWCNGCGTHTDELHNVKVWKGWKSSTIQRCVNCAERRYRR